MLDYFFTNAKIQEMLILEVSSASLILTTVNPKINRLERNYHLFLTFFIFSFNFQKVSSFNYVLLQTNVVD